MKKKSKNIELVKLKNKIETDFLNKRITELEKNNVIKTVRKDK